MSILTPPAGSRGSTSVTWAEVAAAEPPVVLEPVCAFLDSLPLLLFDPPEVTATEPDGEAVWLAWEELAEDPWVAD